MRDTQGCSFGLVPPSAQDWADGRARAVNLADRLGGPVPIAELLGKSNRQGVKGISKKNADRLRNHPHQGWRWNSGDNKVEYWYPQGITGSSDSVSNGTVAGRRVQLVSWYHKTEAKTNTKGVRVSLADITNLNNVELSGTNDDNAKSLEACIGECDADSQCAAGLKCFQRDNLDLVPGCRGEGTKNWDYCYSPGGIEYSHLLLVVPYGDGDQVNYRPLHKSLTDTDAVHAGGIAWYGDYLYVVDTTKGFRVFDMSLIAQVSNTDNADSFGRSGQITHAFGYRYIVPQIARYDQHEDACYFTFSFVSLDRSSNPPALLTGEYKKASSVQGRLVNYLLDPETHKLQVRRGEIRGQEAKMGAQTRMQGAARWQNNYYISSSSQIEDRFGRLYRTRSGRESSISAWVYGAEDLYYERATGVIWTAAEHPGYRENVGIPLLVP